MFRLFRQAMWLTAVLLWACLFGFQGSISAQISQCVACDSCESCPNIDAQVGYTMWWTNGTQLPILVTTSPNGTPQSLAGVLGGAGTRVLYGGDLIGNDLRSGGNVRMTRWLDCDKNYALDLSYFGAGSPGNTDYVSQGNQPAILTRPFFNANSQLQDSQLVRFPGEFAGSLRFDYASEFHSASALGRFNLLKDCGVRHDLVSGYRYFGFREGLGISESVTFINPLGVVGFGTTIDVNESFSVRSNFHGFEIGLLSRRDIGRWELQSSAKIATGGVEKRLTINGSNQVNSNNQQTTSQSGLLAQSSNIGVRVERDFAFLPELGVRGVYALTPTIGLMVGYDAFCLTNAARVGKSIDTSVDLINPGPNTRPQSVIGDSVFFAQGITLGMNFVF